MCAGWDPPQTCWVGIAPGGVGKWGSQQPTLFLPEGEPTCKRYNPIMLASLPKMHLQFLDLPKTQLGPWRRLSATPASRRDPPQGATLYPGKVIRTVSETVAPG